MDTVYEERDRLLRELGFDSYDEYLASELWMEIRTRVLNNANGRCRLCPSMAVIVHHRNYTVLTLKGISWRKTLIPLCNSCHYKLEFDGDVKTPGNAVDAKYQKQKIRRNSKRRKKYGKPWIGLAHKAKHLARRARQGR